MKPGRAALLIVTVLLLLNGVRLFRLDSNPPGYFSDEASNAMHMICIAETGRNALGDFLPLFSKQFEPARQRTAGLIPPTHLYLGALWSRLFGDSMASFRGLSACCMALAVLGVFLLTRLLMGTEAAVFAALSASLSPWGFQVGRIVGMAALVPVCTVFGAWFFLRSNRLRDLTLGGLFWVAALYSYPPARVQAPFLLVAILALKHARGSLDLKKLLIPAGISVAAALPLLKESFSAAAMGRANEVSVLQKDFLQSKEIGGSWLRVGLAVTVNFFKHFSPDYLFFHGDADVRHSTRMVGELSSLDALGLLAGLVLFLMWAVRRLKGTAGDERTPGPRPPLLAEGLFVVAGICSGVLPAAVTQQEVPHALRSIGAWVFVPVLTGLLLALAAARWGNVFRGVVVAVSVVFAGYFFYSYFVVYPTSRTVFLEWDGERRETALEATRTGNWQPFLRVTSNYSDISTRYYLVQYAHESCLSSIDRLRAMRTTPFRR